MKLPFEVAARYSLDFFMALPQHEAPGHPRPFETFSEDRNKLSHMLTVPVLNIIRIVCIVVYGCFVPVSAAAGRNYKPVPAKIAAGTDAP